MTSPRILPTSFPLRHGSNPDLPTWCADKLREAFELGGKPHSDFIAADAVYAGLGKGILHPAPVNLDIKDYAEARDRYLAVPIFPGTKIQFIGEDR